MRVFIFVVSLVFCSSLLYGQIITTVAGNGVAGYSGDGGSATDAHLQFPFGVAIGSSGKIYFSDRNNHCVRMVNEAGIIATIAGTGVDGYSGDGGPATLAQIGWPHGIAVDNAGNVYFSGYGRLRRVDTSGIITTIAGTGTTGYSGDGGPATNANIVLSWGILVDGMGNIYFSQTYRVRKIDAAGIITTVAGTGVSGYGGDGGPATAAQLHGRARLAADNSGNLYIADEQNNRIRKVDTAGIITTIVGTGVEGYTGDGGAATAADISLPMGLAIDGNGNIYFSSFSNAGSTSLPPHYYIRKVNAAGIISTFAGTGAIGYSGDGRQAIYAGFNGVTSMAMYGSGDIYLCDVVNHAVRRIHDDTPSFRGDDVDSLVACSLVPTPINSKLAVRDADTGQLLIWSMVTPPVHGTVSVSYIATATGGVVEPSGLSYTSFAAYTGPDSFTVRVYDEMLSDTVTVHLMVVEDCDVSVAVTDYEDKTALVVFPNPNAGTFTVRLSLPGIVSIYNQQGMLIKKELMNDGKPQQIQVASSGMYVVSATTASGTQSKTIMVLK
jgi:hypothetical protein